jgi:K+-transporting ATPase A subunit
VAWYNVTRGITMLVGRFGPILLALAIAGSLAVARYTRAQGPRSTPRA